MKNEKIKEIEIKGGFRNDGWWMASAEPKLTEKEEWPLRSAYEREAAILYLRGKQPFFI